MSVTNKQQLQANNKELTRLNTIIDGLGEMPKEGLYAWNKYQSKGGRFLGYVVNDSVGAYPADGLKDGYYYSMVKKHIKSLSWKEIKDVSNSGYARYMLDIGDKKTVTLTNGEEVTFIIADFSHDDKVSGGKAGITFVADTCLKDTRIMNSNATSTGGWNGCEMRTYCNSTIYNRMPTDLKPHIVQVKKKGYDGISTTILTSNDYIWLLAEIEVLGEKKHSAGTGEGTKYPIFTDNKSRIRNQNNVPSLWFLRSPFASSSAYFCDVYTSGEISNLSASSTAGVLIGFCI